MYSQADTHIHTTFSDGLMTPEETVAYAAAHTALRVIAITDHGSAEGAFAARAYAQRFTPTLEVVTGQEVYTGNGDVVGLFLNHTLPSFDTAAEAIAAIHTQGGLAIAVHPFSRWATGGNMKGVAQKIFSLPFDGVEVRNGFPANLVSNALTAWLNRSLGQNLPELGGSDSHVAFTVGQALTHFPGHSAAHLRRAIEQGTVRAGGWLWTPASLARLLPLLLLRRGLPKCSPAAAELHQPAAK
jgi:hypothetical protein